MVERLFISDLEGTLTAGTALWSELDKIFGIPEKIAKKHYDQFINGEIDYREWCDLSLDYWLKCENPKPSLNFFNKFFKNHFKPAFGVEEFIQETKQKGYRFIVISNSFSLYCKHAKSILGFDEYVDSNELVFENGLLIDFIPEPYPFQLKARAITDLCKKYKVKPERCVVMGNSDNDLSMLLKIRQLGGVGILINPTDRVKPFINELLSKGVVIIEGHNFSKVLKYL